MSAKQESVASKKPYAGLRPYTRDDREIFFGRERSAQLLRNKIYSSCLTLFYAPSGVGKTSLLQTLVIPDLEALGSHVVYVDSWEDRSICGALKSAISASLGDAATSGLPASDIDSLRLVDVVDSAIRLTDRSVVLILDQFEQYLIRRVDDELPKELGRVARSDLDCYLVLSLREEFVAGLEVLRHDLLNLFDSTFRLEHLSIEDAALAIREPASNYGIPFEDDLVEALLADLRAETGPQIEVSTAIQAGDIELPFLQIVCDRLWSEALSRQLPRIDMDLYRALGERDGILNRFRDDFSRALSRKEQLSAAKVLAVLAPSGGIKNSFTRRGLVQVTGLDDDDVGQIIDLLETSRVIRSREAVQPKAVNQPDASLTRYELYHDAFIRVWRPWIREQLGREESRARGARFGKRAAMVAAIILAVLGYRWWEAEKDYEYLVNGCFDDPETSVETCFDSLASHFLWVRTDDDRFEALRDVLQRRSAELPFNYGLDTSGRGLVREVDDSEKDSWPLVLHYSSQRQLNNTMFLRDWQKYAVTVAEWWGIPVPRRIVLEEEVTYPRTLLRLTGPDVDPYELQVDTFEDDVYLSLDDLPHAANEFFENFSDAWVRHELRTGVVYWTVPRWTLPVWKVSGRLANDGNGFVAIKLITDLLKHPEPLLTPEVADYLVGRIAEHYPVTVAEARRARGDRLAGDIVEMMRSGFTPKRNLYKLLDLLASHPDADESPEQLASVIEHELRDSIATHLPDRVLGPWPDDQEAAEEIVVTDWNRAYREIAPWMDDPEPMARVSIGSSALASEMVNDWNRVQQAVSDAQHSTLRHFGVWPPWPYFARVDFGDEIYDLDQFRIETVNQKDTYYRVHNVPADPTEIFDRLSAELQLHSAAWRVNWITAEYVKAELDALPEHLVAWLTERYSITDIKLLLRGVLNPDDLELQLHAQEAIDRGFVPPREHSIRHVQWLLGSLVFWSELTDDPLMLVEYLRSTQQARIDLDTDTESATPPDPRISQWLEAFNTRDFDGAAAILATALESDPQSAIASFLPEYAAPMRQAVASRLDARCRSLTDPELSAPDRVMLAEQLDAVGDPGSAAYRQLELCAIAGMSGDFDSVRRLHSLVSMLERDTEFATWTPEQLRFAAGELITVAGSNWDPTILRLLSELMLSVTPRLDDQAAASLFHRLVVSCATSVRGPKRPCFSVAEEVASATRSRFFPIILAYQLAFLERRDMAHAALRWLREVDLDDPAMPDALKRNFIIARANALLHLVYLDDESHLADAMEALDAVTNLEQANFGDWAQRQAYSDLLDLHFMRGDIDAQQRLMELKHSRFETAWERLRDQVWYELQLGNGDAAAGISESIISEYVPNPQLAATNSGALFIASLAQILTEQQKFEEVGRRFLFETEHVYREYVAMMLYAFMDEDRADDATRLLTERWAAYESGRNRWPERLRAGDEHAWREMLVGYFLDHMGRAEIFDALETEEAFETSDLNGLFLSRRGLLTEALFYDAMLARHEGDRERMAELLQKTVDIGYARYLEYRMARYLLGQHSADPRSDD